MSQLKVITGLTAVSLTLGAGVVQAEDVTQDPVNQTEVVAHPTDTQTANETVTKDQVDVAKASRDKAASDVNTQKAVVEAASQAKTTAQDKVVTATTELVTAQKTAQKATPEAIQAAQEDETKAAQQVNAANTALEQAKAQETAENQAVSQQETTVTSHQASVSEAHEAVAKAQASVDMATKALDNTSSHKAMAKAETSLTQAKQAVKEAEKNRERATETDAKTAQKQLQAKQTVSEKELAVTNTQKLLDDAVKGLLKEHVSTPLSKQAYYNQRDRLWSAFYGKGSFAATGCVPTSLAMVFTELARREVTPTDVANYLYNQTSEFNKRFSGTSGKGIVLAAEHFGFVPTNISSRSSLEQALKDGHFVVGAVQHNKFSPWGPQYSHEIVMRGYSNGQTFVHDPYNRANIGWYPIVNIWNEQSGDKDDRALGAPFFKIITQKMAQLEAQKAQVMMAVDTAKKQLSQARQELTTVSALKAQVPKAQQALDEANKQLVSAQADYSKAVELARLALDNQGHKEEILKTAKSDLASKQTQLKDRQALLAESQAKLASLQDELALAKQAVGKANQMLSEAKTAHNMATNRLETLKQAPVIQAQAEERLVQAKSELAEASTVLENARAALSALQSVNHREEANYQELYRRYQSQLAKQHDEALLEKYSRIVSGGGQAIPVVNDMGKVIDVIRQHEATSSNTLHQTVSSQDKAKLTPLSVSQKQASKTEDSTIAKPVVGDASHLPSTGEEHSLMAVIGASILAILGTVMVKKQHQKEEN